MKIPIQVAGEKAGVLEIQKEGLYTVFEGRLPAAKELTRLWVVGAGQSAYLGLMEPKGSEQVLRRRLTAAELKKLPVQLEYACTAEPAAETAGAGEAGPAAADGGEGPAAEKQPDAQAQEAGEGQLRPVATGPPAAGKSPSDGTIPAEPPQSPELLWFSRPDGSLTAFDGRFHWLALPVQLRRVPPGLRLLRLGDREYLVFRT